MPQHHVLHLPWPGGEEGGGDGAFQRGGLREGGRRKAAKGDMRGEAAMLGGKARATGRLFGLGLILLDHAQIDVAESGGRRNAVMSR